MEDKKYPILQGFNPEQMLETFVFAFSAVPLFVRWFWLGSSSPWVRLCGAHPCAADLGERNEYCCKDCAVYAPQCEVCI